MREPFSVHNVDRALVCRECDGGLFRLDIVEGKLTITCHDCSEEYDVMQAYALPAPPR